MPGGEHEGIRVLVVDDHPMVRRLIRTICEGDPDLTVVGEAGEVGEVLEAVSRLSPDLVVLDLVLPGGDGLALARRVREGHPETKLLVLSARSEPEVILEAIRAGAHGFLDKAASSEEIAEALGVIARGGRVFSAELERRALAGLGSLARRTREAARWRERLTEREREILQLLARGAGARETAAALHLSVGTVRAHLTDVYRKLDVRGRVEAIGLASRLGLVDLDEPTE